MEEKKKENAALQNDWNSADMSSDIQELKKAKCYYFI